MKCNKTYKTKRHEVLIQIPTIIDVNRYGYGGLPCHHNSKDK